MATVYKVKIVSHWKNYPEETLKKMIETSLADSNNTIKVEVNKQ